MTLTVTTFLQGLVAAGQILTLVEPLATPEVKAYVSVGLGIIQVLLHQYAGFRNPDGTPARVAYIPPEKT